MLIRFWECFDKTQYRDNRKWLMGRNLDGGYFEYINAIKACGQVDIKGWFRPVLDIMFVPSADDGVTDEDIVDVYVQSYE